MASENLGSLSDCYVTQANGKRALAVSGGGQALDVTIQDQITENVNVYMYIDTLETTLSAAPEINDKLVSVASVTGAIVGDSIVILGGTRFFQSIILGISGTDISFASPIDFAFPVGSIVHAGPWNLNLNGSLVNKYAHIEIPENAKFDIYSININITDEVAMDSARFGGITALVNGILFRKSNATIKKNLALVVNNIGFSEQGFTIQYDPKAPSGVYGFQAKKNYNIVSGIALRVDGTIKDELEFIIQDNLTALTSVVVSVQGHVVED